MHRLAPVAVALAAALAILSPASAGTRYVAECGSNGWFGLEPGCVGPMGPKRTIQAAINLAGDGDTILVLPGTYAGGLDTQGKAIHIRAVGGPEVTFIDPGFASRGLVCNSGEDEDTIIEGFTFTRGFAPAGGAVLVALSSPTFIDCVFDGNQAVEAGGAISSQLASPTFTGCRFTDNFATNGGAVRISVGGTVSFEQCVFQANQGTASGGALRAEGGTLILDATWFVQNESGCGLGGAVWTQDTAVQMNSVLMHGNVAAVEGGGLRMQGGSLVVEGSAFTANLGRKSGGGIRLIDVNATMANTQILGNTVQLFDGLADGGGIAISGGSLDAQPLTVTGNAGRRGGGIFVEGASLNLENLMASENTALNGGGIWSENATIVLADATITCCTAQLQGGGIFGHVTQLGMTNSTVSFNDAGQEGGGIRFEGGEMVLDGVIVAHNQSAGSGGGLMVMGPLDAPLTISGSSFDANGAGGFGGGIWMESADLEMTGGSMMAGSAVRGGAIHAEIVDPARHTLRLLGVDLQQNTASEFGGAVFASGLVDLEVRGGQMLGNDAETFGGAIMVSIGTAQIVNSQISGNTATKGGGIHATNSADVRLANVLGTQNFAATSGGFAAASAGAWIEMVNATVALNSAPVWNALVTEDDATIRIRNSIVVGTGTPVGGYGWFDARYSIVPASILGPGCLDADPQFVDIVVGDYRPGPGSPAIDAGLNWFLPADELDVDADGDTSELLPVDRAAGWRVAVGGGDDCGIGRVDMGAYEMAGGLAPAPRIGDLNGDGTVGFEDVLVLLTNWGAAPPCVLADLDGDGVVDFEDLLIVLAAYEG